MKNIVIVYSALFLLLAMGCASEKKQQTQSLGFKNFKDNYAKVSDNLYAGVGEVSNGQYTAFVKHLKENGQQGLAGKYNFDSAQWAAIFFYNEPMIKFYHSHAAYKDYPAVNVSYEGAVAYCQWLTDEYQKNPKRKFKKVVFRLPTEAEWKNAARGSKEGYIFPWTGPYLRNSKGQFLANYKTIEEATAKDTVINGINVVLTKTWTYANATGTIRDNGIITTPVKSYWPNAIGLYNMAGNVSEMLAQKGHTKGGNWHSLGYYLRIDAEDEFAGKQYTPSPFVGFRVFAEVIEK